MINDVRDNGASGSAADVIHRVLYDVTVVVQYYIANLHTSHVTDIKADRQTGRRHACKWITNEQMVTLALCECGGD